MSDYSMKVVKGKGLITLPPRPKDIGLHKESRKNLLESILRQFPKTTVEEITRASVPPPYSLGRNFSVMDGRVDYRITLFHPDKDILPLVTYVDCYKSQPAPTPYEALWYIVDAACEIRRHKNWKEMANDFGHKTQQELRSSQIAWQCMQIAQRQIDRFFTPSVRDRLLEAFVEF